MEKKTNVLVIGAGPTGLTMACELAYYGISCRIIDAQKQPVITSNALAVHTRTLEVFKEMGVLNDMLEVGSPLKAMNIYSGQKRLFYATWQGLKTSYPFVLALPQQDTEKILIKHLAAQGIIVERPKKVVDFITEKNKNRVEVFAENETETIKSDWVIACDGTHSIIREKLGIEFKGEDFKEHFIMMDAPVNWQFPMNEAHAFFLKQGCWLFWGLKSKVIHV